MPHSDPIIEVLAVFRPLFTAPTWRKLMTLLTGNPIGAGAPHGRSCLAGQRQRPGDQLEPLSPGAQPSPLVAGSGESPTSASHCRDLCTSRSQRDLVIDETLERRWGSKISKRGHYRDSALSSRERSVSSPGLRWIVMAVVVTLPWTRTEMGVAVFVCPRHDS